MIESAPFEPRLPSREVAPLRLNTLQQPFGEMLAAGAIASLNGYGWPASVLEAARWHRESHDERIVLGSRSMGVKAAERIRDFFETHLKSSAPAASPNDESS
jgi:hypothetical protein